jgi:hypothetical protein
MAARTNAQTHTTYASAQAHAHARPPHTHTHTHTRTHANTRACANKRAHTACGRALERARAHEPASRPWVSRDEGGRPSTPLSGPPAHTRLCAGVALAGLCCPYSVWGLCPPASVRWALLRAAPLPAGLPPFVFVVLCPRRRAISFPRPLGLISRRWRFTPPPTAFVRRGLLPGQYFRCFVPPPSCDAFSAASWPYLPPLAVYPLPPRLSPVVFARPISSGFLRGVPR